MMYYDEKEALDLYFRLSKIKGSPPFEEFGRCLFLILEFVRYVNGAIFQWNRVQKDSKTLNDAFRSTNITWTDADGMSLFYILLLDIHFYFNCCDNVQRLLQTLSRKSGDPGLEKLEALFWPKFKPLNDARNRLEHIEASLFRKDYNLRLNIDIKGNSTYMICGNSFDLGSLDLDVIKEAYKEVMSGGVI